MGGATGGGMEKDEGLAFRGLGGEVVGHFVGLHTLATATPIAIAFGVIGVAMAILVERAVALAPAAILLGLFVFGASVGRFAAAARLGEADAGVFNNRTGWDEALRYGARYVPLVLAWAVPLGLVAWLCVGKLGAGALAFARPAAVAQGGTGAVATIVLLALALAAIALHAATLVLAAHARTVREAFSLDGVRWLRARGASFKAYIALGIGGMAAMLLYVAPLFLVVAVIGLRASPRFAVVMGGVAWALPGAAVPVLWGRLAGIFACVAAVAPTGGVVVAAGQGITPAPVPVGGGGAGAPPADPNDPVTLARKAPVAETLAALRAQAVSDLEGAIEQAEILRVAHPNNLPVWQASVDLLVKAGRHADAARVGGVVVKLAFAGGAAPLALETFRAHAHERDNMHLDAATLDQLARALMGRGGLNDALWCYRAMLTFDEARAQKGLIALAEATQKAGNAAGAAKIYDYILTTFPASPFRDYVAQARARLKV